MSATNQPTTREQQRPTQRPGAAVPTGSVSQSTHSGPSLTGRNNAGHEPASLSEMLLVLAALIAALFASRLAKPLPLSNSPLPPQPEPGQHGPHTPAARDAEFADPQLKDIAPVLHDPVDRVTKLSSYFLTRSMVLRGHALWDLGKTELSSRGLMAPWTFNVYQSALSALPIICYSAINAFVYPATPTDPFADPSSAAASQFAAQIGRVFLALAVTLSLAILSYAAASGSLCPDDRTEARRARARRAYLYLDGALGFWSQMGLTTFLGLVATGAPWVLFFLIGSVILQLRITSYVIPATLFRINGYPSDYPSLRFWQRDPLRAQWNRYLFWTTAFGFLILVLFPALDLIAYAAGHLVAGVQSSLQEAAR